MRTLAPFPRPRPDRDIRARGLAHALLDALDDALALAGQAIDVAHPELDPDATDMAGVDLPLSSHLAFEIALAALRLRQLVRAYQQLRPPQP